MPIDFYQELAKSQHLDYIALQHPQTWGIFTTFLAAESFDLILVIGTDYGGLTEYMKDLGYTVVSYDMDDVYGTHDALIARGVDIRHNQIFHDDYTNLDVEVQTLIQGGGKTLILCDGAFKAGEFNLLASYLKPGDFIMAHDYCVDCDSFNEVYKDKEWKWLELVEVDIQTQCASLGLVSHQQETFDPIFWVCKKKPTA